MNRGKSPLLALQQDCDQAARLAAQALTNGGLCVRRTFDAQSLGPGTDRIIILLVYGSQPAPWLLIFEGKDAHTNVYIATDPENLDRPVDVTLTQALLGAFFSHP